MNDTTPYWLPERHLGVAATLSHADELIGQVSDLLFEYQTQTGGVIGLKEMPSGYYSRAVVDRVAPIPRKVGLVVADALVALRAALEHVLFTEVEFLHGGPLDEKAARLVEMPASHTYEKFVAWMKGRDKNGPPSLQVGGELVRRIDRLQPFHRNKTPHLHPLARLVIHTNHVKHRTPALTAVHLAAAYQEDQRPRSVHDLPPRQEEPLRVGDVVAVTPVGVQVPITLFPAIGINRPGTDEWPVLMREFEEIFRWVRTQAIPRLVTGAEPPEPALPVRYEIAVGHEDERRAIAAGWTTPAADRHSQRLSAETVRVDLVDLIDQIDGSPNVQQIAAWLHHLSDKKVLDRFAHLRTTDAHDPDIMLRNRKVLEGMRDEAVAFAAAPPGARIDRPSPL